MIGGVAPSLQDVSKHGRRTEPGVRLGKGAEFDIACTLQSNPRIAGPDKSQGFAPRYRMRGAAFTDPPAAAVSASGHGMAVVGTTQPAVETREA